MQPIPWNRPRGSLHSLAHWSEIDEGAKTILLLSDRTLYVLQNLVDLDVGMRSRWIADQNSLGYYPPEPGSDDDDVFQAAVTLAQEELAHVGAISPLIWEPGLTVQSTLSAAAGSNDLTTPESFPGEPVRVEAIFARNITAARSGVYIYLIRSGKPTMLLAIHNSSDLSSAFVSGGIIIPSDAVIQATFLGCLASDSLFLRVWYTGLHWND